MSKEFTVDLDEYTEFGFAYDQMLVCCSERSEKLKLWGYGLLNLLP